MLSHVSGSGRRGASIGAGKGGGGGFEACPNGCQGGGERPHGFAGDLNGIQKLCCILAGYDGACVEGGDLYGTCTP